ncbi:hypothetical protein L0Z72_09685 [candidate division KSB1 bacterium]|nr:hypothetical protein [candidate division KSB1 bacterium]
MKNTIYFLTLVVVLSGIASGQDQYPKFYNSGVKIEHTPQVNVYIISETQFDKTLATSELLKNCDQRIELLLMKIAQQDSIIDLYQAKEANYDSTLTHTTAKLDQCFDESQSCQKELAKQKSCKKTLMGIAGLEAIVLLLVALL